MQVSFALVLLEIIHLTGTSAVDSTAPEMSKDDGCPDEWTLNPTNDRCYFISYLYARFDVAVKKCKAMSSSLASINSVEEQIFLLQLLDEQRCNNSNYWLGLHNASARWTWIDGSPFTSKTSLWGEKFPSGKYDCGFLSAEQISTKSIGHWEDEHCDIPMRYICKKDSYYKAPALSIPTGLDCPKGWFTIPPFTSCFYLGKDELTYDIAYESCKSRSAVLAKLHSVDELKAVGNVMAMERNTCMYYEFCSKFWIGLRFNNVSGKKMSSWVWSDGRTENNLNIASFGLETPSNEVEQCAAIQVGDGNESSYAVVSGCGNSLRYLCRRDPCPEGFVLMPKVNSCYKLITEAMNWTDASKTCQNIATGAHLVNILNRAENDAVIAFMEREIYRNPSLCRSPHTGYSPNVWIGAQRIFENCYQPFVWKPSDKVQIPLNYTYWFHHQPSCDYGKEYCLHITKIWSYQWNDHRCDEKKCSLCERRFEKRN